MKTVLLRHRVAALLSVVCASLPVQAAPGDLRDELETLARQGRFTIEGLDRLEPGAVAARAEGTPTQRIKTLLEDYNYLLIGTPKAIEQVRITSRKPTDGPKASADRAYIKTQRSGSHHQVPAAIVGPNGVAKNLFLLVDTGATTLVLPDSLIAELGFAPDSLQPGISQTASGHVPVRIGVLDSVRVGAVSAQNIQVSFIADDKLQGTLLLGMSFLQRFRMTIDDAHNELILMAK